MFASVLCMLSIFCVSFFGFYIFFNLVYVMRELLDWLEEAIKIVFPALFTCLRM